jgi:hypothetical protein
MVAALTLSVAKDAARCSGRYHRRDTRFGSSACDELQLSAK